KAQVSEGMIVVAGAMAFIAFMLLVGRPLLGWMARRWATEQKSQSLVTVLFITLLLSALATEAIGIHAIFGAFLLGAMIPHDSMAAKTLTHQLKHVVSILLLPAFFALTGMRTRIDLLDGQAHWLMCGLIVLVATLGKFGGTLLAARLTGLSWRNSTVLGAL